MSGCTEAKQRLTPVDIKRNADPQYWNGWNKVGVISPPPQSQEAESNKKVTPISPNINVLQLPSSDMCPAFAASYANMDAKKGARGAPGQHEPAEVAVFKRYFSVDVDSASENDMKSMFMWIDKCDYSLHTTKNPLFLNMVPPNVLYDAKNTLEENLKSATMKIGVSKYMEAISNIPECADESVINLFKSTISYSSQAKTRGLKLLAVKGFRDVTHDVMVLIIRPSLEVGGTLIRGSLDRKSLASS